MSRIGENHQTFVAVRYSASNVSRAGCCYSQVNSGSADVVTAAIASAGTSAVVTGTLAGALNTDCANLIPALVVSLQTHHQL
jgi:hypothetical protein